MYWDAITVKPDFGVFKEMRDVSYFNQVGISLGAITWPHEQDIAPETLEKGLILDESVSALFRLAPER